MERLARLYPRAPVDIFCDFREKGEHHRKMERTWAVTARLSLILTALLALAALIIAVVLGLNDKQALAAVFGVGGLSPVFIAMIRGGGRWTGR